MSFQPDAAAFDRLQHKLNTDLDNLLDRHADSFAIFDARPAADVDQVRVGRLSRAIDLLQQASDLLEDD
jgi:hypothetical protein